MSPLSVGIRIPARRPVTEVAEAAHRAEAAGFDDVVVPDSQLLWRRDRVLALPAAA